MYFKNKKNKKELIIAINLQKYLTSKDMQKIKTIKKAVKTTNNIWEVEKYEKKMKYFVKKAYIRMQMEKEKK